jgi:hypothetical protein
MIPRNPGKLQEMVETNILLNKKQKLLTVSRLLTKKSHKLYEMC